MFTLVVGHVRYINFLTWLRGFQVKSLYLVLFSLYPSLFWEFRNKRNLKIRSHARILIHRTWPIDDDDDVKMMMMKNASLVVNEELPNIEHADLNSPYVSSYFDYVTDDTEMITMIPWLKKILNFDVECNPKYSPLQVAFLA